MDICIRTLISLCILCLTACSRIHLRIPTCTHSTRTSTTTRPPRPYWWRHPSRSTRAHCAFLAIQQVLEEVVQFLRPALRWAHRAPEYRRRRVGAPARLPTPGLPKVMPFPLPHISTDACSTVFCENDDELKGPTRLGTSSADATMGAREIPRGYRPARRAFSSYLLARKALSGVTSLSEIGCVSLNMKKKKTDWGGAHANFGALVLQEGCVQFLGTGLVVHVHSGLGRLITFPCIASGFWAKTVSSHHNVSQAIPPCWNNDAMLPTFSGLPYYIYGLVTIVFHKCSVTYL